jgi:hypothetical protein
MITKKTIRHLRKIERAVYPAYMQQMQDIRNVVDLAIYCEGRPHVRVWRDGYIIYTRREIVDLCSLSPLSWGEINMIYKTLRKFYKSRKISADLRETTSYRLIKLYEKRGKIELLHDTPWYWGNEVYHEVTVRFMKGGD